MTRLPRAIVTIATMLLCIGCDQASKLAAQAQLPRFGVISLLGDTLRLQYVENPGAFLGLGGGLPDGVRRTIFVGGVIVALLVVAIGTLAARRLPASRVLALALICGGGVGNLIDRIFRDGRVIDFLNVGVGPLRTGIFNVADVALVAGVALLAFAGHTSEIRPPRDAPPPQAFPPTARA